MHTTARRETHQRILRIEMSRSGSKGRKPQVNSTRKSKKPEVLSDHSDLELDDFQRQEDEIKLDADHDGSSDFDDIDEEAVYGLDNDNYTSDEEDEDEDEMQDATLAKMAKQAQLLGQKLKLQEEEDGDEEEEEEVVGKRWGANKKAYYDADTADFEVMDDDEALKEEEQEVLRLQREAAEKLMPSDFGIEEEDEDEEREREGGDTLEQQLRKAEVSGRGAAEVEEVAKDLSSISKAEQMAALMEDAPELLALLTELTDSLAEVRHRVGPLLKEVKEGGLATSEGLSYLEAKHLLLLQYCIHIVFYLLLKAEGRPVKDHPVIGRLVELRTFIEKVRPIDKQLAYQIDKLLRAIKVAKAAEQSDQQEQQGEGRNGAVDEDPDMLKYGPNPSRMLPKGAEDEGADNAEADGVYRPPKLNPVAMPDDPDQRTMNTKERRRLKEAARRASQNEMVRELAEEVLGAPEELRASVAGMDSLAALRQRQKLEARAEVEEDLFTRVALSKEEAKRLKAHRRAGLAGQGLLEDFADEVADIVELAGGAEEEKEGGLAELLKRSKVSQKYGADVSKEMRAMRGGDEDLPRRMPLHERRAKYDSVAARRAARQEEDDEDLDEDEGPGPRGKRDREEDDFYRAAKEASMNKKKARKGAYETPGLLPPRADEETRGARGITYEIEKNRGLTPHRRKDLKNPRKKHRVKFQKALVRRKGQVQEVVRPESRYGGEATGIKAKVSKSRRFN